MPLVQNSDLPTYERLRQEGHHVLTRERAGQQDIRDLHVGLLNMMPDAALAATERQFFRLVGSSNPISQFHMHTFTLDSIVRGEVAAQHIDRYYESFSSIKEHGLDALIISGANVVEADLSQEVFWAQLMDVAEWAHEHVTSTLCSCLATHALLLGQYGIKRTQLNTKCWGVFEHEMKIRSHPLVSDVNTHIVVPHSRFNNVSAAQMREKGMHVLAEGDEPGVQLAVSPDGFRTVFFQGHPEYDRISLMKEYKRDIGLYVHGELHAYPPMPLHYFNEYATALLVEFRESVINAMRAGNEVPDFPESHIIPHLRNVWHDSGEAVVGNWLGLMYQLTNSDRRIQFMDGVDPNDPLGWLAKGAT